MVRKSAKAKIVDVADEPVAKKGKKGLKFPKNPFK